MRVPDFANLLNFCPLISNRKSCGPRLASVGRWGWVGQGGGGVGWRGSGNLGVNVVLWASISKPTTFIYLAFEKKTKKKQKKQTHSYTWSSKMLTHSYTALWLLYPFMLVVRQILIHWIPREQAPLTKLWAKNYTRMSEKWGLSHTNQEK